MQNIVIIKILKYDLKAWPYHRNAERHVIEKFTDKPRRAAHRRVRPNTSALKYVPRWIWSVLRSHRPIRCAVLSKHTNSVIRVAVNITILESLRPVELRRAARQRGVPLNNRIKDKSGTFEFRRIIMRLNWICKTYKTI